MSSTQSAVLSSTACHHGCKESTQSECVETRRQWKDALVMIAIAAICLVPIIALTASAFVVVPGSELQYDCLAAVSADQTTSELSLVLQAFVAGWLGCLAVKLCHKYGRSVYTSGSAASRSFVECVQTHVAAKRDALVVIGAGMICTAPIVVLILSAFAAVPGSESGDDGLASEGSLIMRAFTMGWMFCLAIKLCRELVGLVGTSSCMALVSC